MLARASLLVGASLLVVAGPAPAVDFVVTNCSRNTVAIYTYDNNDPLKLFPARLAHVAPGKTEPVGCYTGTCALAYAMEGGHSARPAREFSTDLCFRGWYSWSGAGNGSLEEGNCSMDCSNPQR